MLVDSEGGLQLRVFAVYATSHWPIHQAFSHTFPRAFAVAAAILELGPTSLALSAALIAEAEGSWCEKTQSAPLLQVPFLWGEHGPLWWYAHALPLLHFPSK